MRRLQPIVWSKGALLSAQQLQQQDAYTEGTLQFHLHALAFRPWGFRSLRIDREALTGSYLAVNTAAGMFADGLIFDFPESDTAPDPKPLAEYFSGGKQQVEFSLAIPFWSERQANLGASGTARYSPAIELVKDENDGLAEKALQIGRRSFQLLAHGEDTAGFATLPLARVIRTAAASYELDDGFVPPVLRIGASPYLATITRRLVEILSSRSTTLSGSAVERRSLVQRDFTAADIPNFWLLYTINSWLPVFRHMYDTQSAHPEALFSAMTAFAGTLATFSANLELRNFPAYDHQNSAPGFVELDSLVRSLLESAVPRRFISLPLKPTQPAIYATALDKEQYLAAKRMYLAIRCETKPGDVIEKAPRLIKVGSAHAVDQMVRQALPGAALTHVPLPPGAVPVKLDFQYFSIDQSGPGWDSVVRSRNLAAYVPAELGRVELELIMLLPDPI